MTDLEASVTAMEYSIKVRSTLHDMAVYSCLHKSPYRQVRLHVLSGTLITTTYHVIHRVTIT